MPKKKAAKKAQPAVTIRVGNPGNIVTIRVPGRSKKQAMTNARRFMKRHTKNVEMGFWAGGRFHPIRAFQDYDSRRVLGEAVTGSLRRRAHVRMKGGRRR